MSTGLLTKKVSSDLTEQDILKSLESAISSYNTKTISDFHIPKKQKVKNSKIGKTKMLPEEVLETVEDVPSPYLLKKTKTKKVPAQKKKKVKTSTRIKKSLGKFLSFSKSSKETVKPVYKLSTKRNRNVFSQKVSSIPVSYKRYFLSASLSVMMFAFVGFTTYIAYAYVASTSNSDIVEKVSSHVILPTGETPKVYIIQSEKSDIFQNPLFKGIEIGDNVLSYTASGKVVIYRSAEDKIVNIVNISE